MEVPSFPPKAIVSLVDNPHPFHPPKAAIVRQFDLMTDKCQAAISLHLKLKVLEKKIRVDIYQKWKRLIETRGTLKKGN